MNPTSVRLSMEANFPEVGPELIEETVDSLVREARMPAVQVERWRTEGVQSTDLICGLLEIAGRYALAPLSGHRVGCAALSAPRLQGASGAVYLGANFEFPGAPPNHTLHAEQAAVNHAWISGERGIELLATTSAPCGHCRQFLAELEHPVSVVHAGSNAGSRRGSTRRPRHLSDLLPERFGPADLGVDAGLMAYPPPSTDEGNESVRGSGRRKRRDRPGTADPLFKAAGAAAEASYAPYTQNRAGAAIRLGSGAVWVGRYAENAAYNPALLPMTSAVSRARLHGWEPEAEGIARAVLVAQDPAPHVWGARAVLASLGFVAELEVSTLAQPPLGHR